MRVGLPLFDEKLLRLCKHTVLCAGHAVDVDTRGEHSSVYLKCIRRQCAAQIGRQLFGEVLQGSCESLVHFYPRANRRCVTAPDSVLP